jgi:hypothetical protein
MKLMSYGKYRFLDEDVKQDLFEKWCRLKSLDPDTETAAEQFFEQMDQDESAALAQAYAASKK